MWWRTNSVLAYFRLLRVGVHLLWGAMQIALCFPFLEQEQHDRRKRGWSRQLLSLLGIHIENADQGIIAIDSGLLVCNHISFIDIFVINAVLPSGFVAKSEVAHWPLIGWMCRRTGTLFIERGSRQAIQRTRQHMHEVLTHRQRLAVFPEGTTTAGDRVLPFHAALLQSAIDADVDVHALAISYHQADGRRSDAAAYINQDSLIGCMLRTLRSGGIEARLTVAARFSPPYPDRRHLSHQAHQAVVVALGSRNEAN